MNLNQRIALAIFSASLLISGCGTHDYQHKFIAGDMNNSGGQQQGGNNSNSGNNNSNNGGSNNGRTEEQIAAGQTGRFGLEVVGSETMRTDKNQKLAFVASKGVNGNAVKMKYKFEVREIAAQEAEDFCANLTFANYADWRVPLPNENSKFISDMKQAKLEPYYLDNKCEYVIAINRKLNQINGTITNQSESIGKHNAGRNPGWTTLIRDANKANSYAIRCVRDVK